MPQFYDIAIRALNQTDSGLSAAIKSVNQFGNQIEDQLRPIFGKRGGLDSFADILQGRGAVGGLTQTAQIMSDVAKSAKLFADELVRGQQSVVALISDAAKGIPVFGAFYSAGQDIRAAMGASMLAAERSGGKRMKVATGPLAMGLVEEAKEAERLDRLNRSLVSNARAQVEMERAIEAEKREELRLNEMNERYSAELDRTMRSFNERFKAEVDAREQRIQALFDDDDAERAKINRTVQMQARAYFTERMSFLQSEYGQRESAIRAAFSGASSGGVSVPQLSANYRGVKEEFATRQQDRMIEELRGLRTEFRELLNWQKQQRDRFSVTTLRR